MSFYKKVVMIGATSGIGEALTKKFIENGTFVIAVGRRKENLEGLVQQYGHEKVQAVPFDIIKLEQIPHFVTNITSTHPDLDCVFLNSGIQRGFDFSRPESVGIDVIQEEFTTNYISYVSLTKYFLPFLIAKESPTSLVFTTSGLALVPLPRCPNYCASKAAMHHFILSLRIQLEQTPVKVIELFPPAVQTELHDEKHQPDIKDGRSIGMPLEEFTDKAWTGLSSESEQIPIGTAEDAFKDFEEKRQEALTQMVVQMRRLGMMK